MHKTSRRRGKTGYNLLFITHAAYYSVSLGLFHLETATIVLLLVNMNLEMGTKITSIESLAIMVKNGFDKVDQDIRDLRNGMGVIGAAMATKQDLVDLEYRLINRFDSQIEVLRDDIRILKTKAGVR
jgi:hypothetical protein